MDFTSESSQAPDEKLQLLQLQCVIDAKDREIQILRSKLSSQEDAEMIAGLQNDLSRLRSEVQRLSQENVALRAQQGIVSAMRSQESACQGAGDTCRSGGGSTSAAASAQPAPSRGAPDSAPGGKPVAPSAAAVDTGALVEKLRSLVTGLVAEALAQQQQQLQQSHLPLLQPHGSASSSVSSVTSGSTSAREPLPHPHPLQHAHRLAPPPFHGSLAQYQEQQQQPGQPAPQSGPGVHFCVPDMTAWAPTASHGGFASSGDIFPASCTTARPLPGLHVFVQQVPPPLPLQHSWLPEPQSTWPLAAASAGTQRPAPPHAETLQAATHPRVGSAAPAASGPAADATASSGPDVTPAPTGRGVDGRGAVAQADRSAVPAVLELNVDGTVVLVERAVLEMQALGSKLHNTLICQYDKLPRDSAGRPYLSYDPRVFQVLLSFLKERWLFGAAAPPRDWPQVICSLGVSAQYFRLVASHFGLLGDVEAQPPETKGGARPSSNVENAATAAATSATLSPSSTIHVATSRVPEQPPTSPATNGQPADPGPVPRSPAAGAVRGDPGDLRLALGPEAAYAVPAVEAPEQEQRPHGQSPTPCPPVALQPSAAAPIEPRSTPAGLAGEEAATQMADPPRDMSVSTSHAPSDQPGAMLAETTLGAAAAAAGAEPPTASPPPLMSSYSTGAEGMAPSSAPGTTAAGADPAPEAAMQAGPEPTQVPATQAGFVAAPPGMTYGFGGSAASTPYRMPSLYTLLAEKQRAEEGAQQQDY